MMDKIKKLNVTFYRYRIWGEQENISQIVWSTCVQQAIKVVAQQHRLSPNLFSGRLEDRPIVLPAAPSKQRNPKENKHLTELRRKLKRLL